MLARLLRLFLLFELFAYFILILLRVKLGGETPFSSMMLVILLAIGWRSCAVGLTYLFAFLNRRSLPDEHRIGAGRHLLEGLQELGAFAAVLVAGALDPWPIRRRTKAGLAAGQLPLLLIHGYCCNRSFWWWLKPRLEAQGRFVAALTLEPLHGAIDRYAEQVAQAVNALCRVTGASQVILIGHSMGGLVARAYLRRYGELRVARLITLGTPHQGSLLACLGLGRNAREMEPGNAWLRTLAQSPLLVPTLAVFSHHDNLVLPPTNAALGGAENLALAGVGHLSMSISPEILAVLLEATASQAENPLP